MKPNIQICVFAYNLQSTIADSLNSLLTCCGEYPVQVYVMINGCRDHTLSVVSEFAKRYLNVYPIEITLGDKSNAWNTFVHQYYDGESIAVFADGDLTFAELAIAQLVDYHLNNPHFLAVSSFPCLKGRSAQAWRSALLREHQFTGNLYLLSPTYIQRIVANNVRLPTGLIGDDSMLGFLTATDLCSGKDTPLENIGVCTDAVFNYEPLNPWHWQDIKLYLRRRVRYSKRHMQQSSIVPKLKRDGLSVMPKYASQIDTLSIRWLSSNVLFDLIAARSIRREGKRES